jgi:transcriptional regulator with XRE-family HTH domain
MRQRRPSVVIPVTVCRQRREALKMTQQELADLARVAQPYISRIERMQDVRREDLEAVARVLELDPDLLMSEAQ